MVYQLFSDTKVIYLKDVDGNILTGANGQRLIARVPDSTTWERKEETVDVEPNVFRDRAGY